MSASLPQSMALAGLLWLVVMAAVAVLLTCRRIDPAQIRAVLLPGMSAIAAMILVTWTGHAVAGTRGVAVGAMVLLFAIFALFAYLRAIARSRAASTGHHPPEPIRPI